MLRFIDRTGKRYGRLLVVEYAGKDIGVRKTGKTIGSGRDYNGT